MGKGLGRNETGISKPLKNYLKFDKAGIGYQKKVNEESTSRWWENVYDQAASNVGSSESDKIEKNETSSKPTKTLTDEDLFIACGGRTAHKAARHGLRLSGKLKRIDHQEEIQNVKKIKKNKSEDTVEEEKELCDVDSTVYADNESRVEKTMNRNKLNKEIMSNDGSCDSEIRRKSKKNKKDRIEMMNDVIYPNLDEKCVIEYEKSPKKCKKANRRKASDEICLDEKNKKEKKLEKN